MPFKCRPSISILGVMPVTRIDFVALSRTDSPEPDRRDFYLYVDEFPSLTTTSLARMLSVMSKYRVDLCCPTKSGICWIICAAARSSEK